MIDAVDGDIWSVTADAACETLAVYEAAKETGCHRQARVGNGFFRYKSIIGDCLRARTPAEQDTETILACNILNRMTELGRPASYSIAADQARGSEAVAGHVPSVQQHPASQSAIP